MSLMRSNSPWQIMPSHCWRWGIHFDLANKKDRVEELDKTMEEPGFWDNPEKSTAIVQESKHLKDVIERYEKLCADILGTYVRDVMKLNLDARNFRIFAPDETASNRLHPVFEVTGRRFLDEQIPNVDEDLDPDGRVMDSMLSEHFCEGFLEGYLLTGRHGFFDSYEAFIRIVDSMFAQHAKWLKTCNELPWRHDIASLNYILASNVWQQDHNGFTHQDPGFLDHVANKKADVVRIYLPPDANCLLSVFDHCIKSRNYVNVMVASKHPRPQWLTMDQAVKHCTQGIGIWDWASNDQGEEPDVVMVFSSLR